VLHLAGDYGVIELAVEPQDWLAEQQLAELHLPDEGVLVLGVQRSEGGYLGAPKGTTRVHAGDTLILYGRSPVLADLDRRRSDRSGEDAHRAASADQQRVLDRQRQVDKDA
jgi:Trk K+ transport system NAD-binding subunit